MKNGWHQNKYGNLHHYVNNKHHNEKSSASIWNNGTKIWCQNNKYHRIDGSAIEWNDGDKEYWYQNEEIKCNSQEEFERFIKLRLLW